MESEREELRRIENNLWRRVELKRIDNMVERQVTLSIGRNSLIRKARDLSNFCDAEVALIIFSDRGKLVEYCSSSSMPATLERYHKSRSSGPQNNNPPTEAEVNFHDDYLRLKSMVEDLEQSQRNLLGKHLEPLGLMELEQLESTLERSLKQVKSTKEQRLQVSNADLTNKLDEGGAEIPQNALFEAGQSKHLAGLSTG